MAICKYIDFIESCLPLFYENEGDNSSHGNSSLQ